MTMTPRQYQTLEMWLKERLSERMLPFASSIMLEAEMSLERRGEYILGAEWARSGFSESFKF